MKSRGEEEEEETAEEGNKKEEKGKGEIECFRKCKCLVGFSPQLQSKNVPLSHGAHMKVEEI